MKLSPARIRWFRLRRHGLVRPFGSAERAARDLLGIQAQLLPAAALALGNRVAGLAAADVDDLLLRRRRLVKLWGQRNTLHLYASEDWPLLQAAFRERRSQLEARLETAAQRRAFRGVVRRTGERLAKGEALSHRDVRSKALADFESWRLSYATFMTLAYDGLACHGEGSGGETRFVHRTQWLPDLAWSPPDAAVATAELARRYLAAYGPATEQDLAFWYGTSGRAARAWLAALGDEVAEVDVEGERRLALRADLAALDESPGRWPVRLLYRFDPLLLAHRDKGWLVEDAHYKKVWRPGGHVEAVVLARGRIAGTWRYDRKPKGLAVSVAPFERPPRALARAVEGAAARVAAFLDLPLTRLDVR